MNGQRWIDDKVVVNLLAGLIAYCHQPKKPSLHLQALSRLEVAIPN